MAKKKRAPQKGKRTTKKKKIEHGASPKPRGGKIRFTTEDVTPSGEPKTKSPTG